MLVIVLYSSSFLCFSLEVEEALDNSANLYDNEDIVSLSDIVPETNICFVSLNDKISQL